MKSLAWNKVTGWSGIAFVVLFLISELSLADTPTLDTAATEVRQWFEVNSSQINVSQWGAGLSIGLFFLLFASGLYSRLGPADSANKGVWSRLSFAGAVTLVAIAGAHSGFWAVLSQENLLTSASDETVKTLAAFETVMLTTVIAFSVAVFLLAASVVILQSRVMAKWLGWVGLVVAALLAVGSLWTVTGDEESLLGYFVLSGFGGWLIWTFGAAISLLRSSSVPEHRDVGRSGSSEIPTST